jgi:exoribonuclease-2
MLDEKEMINRIGASEAMTGTIRQLERLSNQHWTMVYLMQNPDWHGKAIVLENRERFSIVLIPELGMETKFSSSKSFELNEEITIKVNNVDLPFLTAHFSLV